MDTFRVRLNCIDHYQAAPTRYDPQLRKDDGNSNPARQPKVPVIRVFGSTETGQKVCAHIHGAFPYLYIEYQGPLDKPIGGYLDPFIETEHQCSNELDIKCLSTCTSCISPSTMPWPSVIAGITS